MYYSFPVYSLPQPERNKLIINSVAFTLSLGGWYYVRTYHPNQWIGGGLPMGWHADDGSWEFVLPFDFPFYGTYYRTIYISSNGLITFTGPDGSFSNSIPELATRLAIAVAWDDWVTYEPFDIYTWQLDSDHMLIRWEVQAYGSSTIANFEVILSRDGIIQIDFGYNDGPVSTTVGVSNGVNDVLAEDLTNLNYINTIVFTPAGVPAIHDVAVTNVTPSKTVVGQGYNMDVYVTVANKGSYTETFDVTLYAGTPFNVPLLEDNFDDGVIDESIWSIEVARVGYGIWKIMEYGTSPPFITASEENGKLRLSGYGYSYYNYDRVLISKMAFSGAFTLEVEMTSLTGSGTGYGGGIVIVKDDFTAMHLIQSVGYWYAWPSDYRDFGYLAVESVIDGTPEAPPSPGGVGTPHLGEGQVKAPGPVTYPIKLKCIYNGINEFKLYWIMDDQTYQTTYISPETFDTYRIAIFADARLGEDYVDAEFDNLKLYGSPISQTGLVGYWNFDEGTGTIAHDSSGNNNHGTLMNGPTWVDGKIGKALYFDGTDDYIRIEDSATISSPSVTSAITVMAWVKPDPGFLDRFARVIASHWTDGEGQIGGSSNAWALEALNDVRYHAVISAGDDATWIDLASNTAPQEGVWQHLAFTWDGSTVTFYFNGVIDATGIYTATISDSSRPMQIAKTDLLWYVWKGFIDEVKVYNRSLSADEVWAEYTGQTGFVIGTQTVTLESEASTTLTFTWNTTGFAKGNYTIWAYAWPVQGETDTADNTFTDGIIYLGIPGDIKPDGTVDIYDALKLAAAFGSKLTDPNWNPNADINCDGIVDIYDALKLAANFGKTDP